MISKLDLAIKASNDYAIRSGSIEVLANRYELKYNQLQRFLSDNGYRYGKAPSLKRVVFFEDNYPYLYC